MKINEVFDAVYKARVRAIRKDQYAEPIIRVYMDHEYWEDCMAEINGEVSPSIFEFFSKNTILGHEVFQVLNNKNSKRHAPFKVVDFGAGAKQ